LIDERKTGGENENDIRTERGRHGQGDGKGQGQGHGQKEGVTEGVFDRNRERGVEREAELAREKERERGRERGVARIRERESLTDSQAESETHIPFKSLLRTHVINLQTAISPVDSIKRAPSSTPAPAPFLPLKRPSYSSSTYRSPNVPALQLSGLFRAVSEDELSTLGERVAWQKSRSKGSMKRPLNVPVLLLERVPETAQPPFTPGSVDSNTSTHTCATYNNNTNTNTNTANKNNSSSGNINSSSSYQWHAQSSFTSLSSRNSITSLATTYNTSLPYAASRTKK
jgi:hypothetical protein